MKQFVLKLYALRPSRTLDRAVAEMREAGRSDEAGGFSVEVIDIRQRPRLEGHERILASPSLASSLPPMLQRRLDALFRQEPTLIGLDVSLPDLQVRPVRGRRVTKAPSDIPGFDFIAQGGLPLGRSTLVAGTSGAGKTIFSAQFLVEGIRRHNEPGVFVTFEEQPDDIRGNLASFDWDIEQWESEGAWGFVDASPDPTYKMTITGEFEFDGLIARIQYAAGAIGAKRAALDSIGTIFSQFPDSTRVRYELYRLIAALREIGLTSVLTAERIEEYGSISRHGIEEFAADNVVILRNVLDSEKRRRTIEILKMRGAAHKKGEYPFTITPSRGIVIIPHTFELRQESSAERISAGNAGLDELYGGGLFREAVVLAHGPTGTGKTLLAAHFIAGAAQAGERSLYLGYEEGHHQLARNARGWGIDFDGMETAGLLQVVCCYPESASLEDHLVTLENHVRAFRPQRLVLDPVSALERIASRRGFREYLLAVTSLLKQEGICGLFTTSLPMSSDTAYEPTFLSALTDVIVKLRLVEVRGDLVRGINVLKMRGSKHDKRVREFEIGDDGLHIGGPMRVAEPSPQDGAEAHTHAAANDEAA